MKLQEFLFQLGQPVAYYPKLAKFLGSVKAAVFLCQLGYWEGKQKDQDGIYKTMEEFKAETGLSRREQDTARKTLRDLDFLEETKKGMPARIFYFINWKKINKEWREWIKNEAQQESKIARHKSAKQEWRKRANKNGRNSQTGSANLASKNQPQNHFSPRPENTAKITKEITYKEVKNYYPKSTLQINRGFESFGEIANRTINLN